MTQEMWLTKRELAGKLQVSVRTIERHVRPSHVVGGQNRYLLTEVVAQLRGEPLPPSAIPEEEPTPTPKQHLYFIREEVTGQIKIGIALDVRKRLRTLRTARPGEITLLGVIRDAGDQEGQIHAKFADHRTHGEWFSPAAGLLAYVEENAVEL